MKKYNTYKCFLEEPHYLCLCPRWMLRVFLNATLHSHVSLSRDLSHFAEELACCGHSQSWTAVEGSGHLNLGVVYPEITVKSGKCLFSIFSMAEHVRKAFSQSCGLLIRYV